MIKTTIQSKKRKREDSDTGYVITPSDPHSLNTKKIFARCFTEQRTSNNWNDFTDATVDSVKLHDIPEHDSWRTNENSKDVDLMIIDVYHETYLANNIHYYDKSYDMAMLGDQYTHDDILHLICLDPNGNTATVNVYGFEHYMYVKYKKFHGLDTTKENSEHLYNILSQNAEYMYKKTKQHKKFEVHMSSPRELIFGVDVVRKEDIMYFKPVADPTELFYKIRYNPVIKNEIYRALTESTDMFDGVIWDRTYESTNINYILRFLVDKKITSFCWCKIPAKTFYNATNDSVRLSSSQCEYYVHVDDLVSDEAKQQTIPMRMLSYDLEVMNDGTFPTSDKDPIIEISVVFDTIDASGNWFKPRRDIVLAIGTVSMTRKKPYDVYTFDSERNMLIAFFKLFKSFSPVFISGHNIDGFDSKYLMDRAKLHMVGDEYMKYFSQLTQTECFIKQNNFASKQAGPQSKKPLIIPGVITADIYGICTREYKLRSYRLNSLASEFLGDQKEDVSPDQIPVLQMLNSETRDKLTLYCWKDSDLNRRIVAKRNFVYNNFYSISRVQKVLANDIYYGGQSKRVFTMILRDASSKGFICPTFPRSSNDNTNSDPDYSGAFVLEPITGYYDRPIATNDFTGLYPSIIRAHNLDYTTLIDPINMIRESKLQEIFTNFQVLKIFTIKQQIR